MPTKLPPLTAFCRQCGWKKSLPPMGDVIMGLPERCPQCGNPDLQLKPSSLLESALRVLTEVAKK